MAPIDYPDPSVPVSYDRFSKRSTFVACIAADGFRMKPFANVPRFTAVNDLSHYAYDESNMFLTSQNNACMKRASFELWAITGVVPTIDQCCRDLG
jgi:hypothetical protein